MIKFCEELLRAPETTPVVALHRAQQWLRELHRNEVDAFCAKHPELAADTARRRGEQSASIIPDSGPPYGDPEFWAGFVVMGC